MSQFLRKIIQPDQGFITDIITKRIASMIPLGYRWFGQDSTDSDKELGKQIRALGKVIGNLATAIEHERYQIFTQTVDLDPVGNALKIPRILGETTDAYFSRITGEIVAERVTPLAIMSALTSSNPGVGFDLYEPWTDLMLWGEVNLLSSQMRLTDQYFYRGGTFQIITNDYVPHLESTLDKLRAGGFKAFTKLSMETLVDVNSDTLAALSTVTGERMSFVSMSMDVSPESFGIEFEFDPVAMEIGVDVTQDIYAGYSLTWASGFLFNNLTKNYILQTDMIASATAGIPVYYILVMDSFDPTQPSEWQPAPQMNYLTALGSGGVLGDGGTL